MDIHARIDALSSELATTDGGSSQRHLPQVSWQVPGVISQAGGRLVWNRGDAEGEGRRANVSPQRFPFESFLKLAEGSDQEIVAFAGRWGVLNLCSHDFRPARCTKCESFVQYGLGLLSERSESIAGWRWWAATAVELLSLAVEESKEGYERLRALLSNHDQTQELVALPEFRPRAPAVWFTNYLWLSTSGVGLRLDVGEPIPSIVFGGSDRDGLFPHLAFQLAAHIAQADHVFICASCQWPTERKSRRPKAGQNNYCSNPECQRRQQSAYESRRSEKAKRGSGP